MKLLIILFCLIFIPGQFSASHHDVIQSNLTNGKIFKYKNALEVVNETDILNSWLSINYYPNLNFAHKKNTVTIEFNGQCQYNYPVIAKGKLITVYYDLKEDCTSNIGVKESFGLMKRPKKGMPFIILTLVNDSTLEANNLYKNWGDSINFRNKNYPCFVKQFKLKTLKK